MRIKNFGRAAVLGVSLLLVLPACDETDCSSFPATFVDVEGVNLIPYSRQISTLLTGQVVRANDLLLRLELRERQYSASRPSRGGFAAWADCSYPVPAYTEKIDSILVTSRSDYDAQHPAATALNDLIRITYRGGDIALQDLLATPQGVEVIKNQHLTVTAPPARSGTQQFQVRIHLVGGEVQESTIATVDLQP